MQLSSILRTGIWIAALCLCVQGQTPPAKDAPSEAKGMPPRTAPTEYQAHAQAGTVTIAAEFTGHAVGTPQGTLTTEEDLVVETGFFGPAGGPPAEKKSKASMSTGGGGGQGQSNAPPVVPKMSFPERRAMEQKVQKATLPEGDRALPVAGLIFFQYGGKTKGIKSLELIYEGPAGKATLTLQP